MGALDGVKVLEVGLLIQGPQATATMHDWGAEVIKVELPNFGDQARWLLTPDGGGRSPYFLCANRGKRSVTVDLRVPDGRDVFLKLAEWADVVVSNFKPGTMEQWGLGYAELSARNPMLIVATASTYGPLGPDSTREGADLAGQAIGGVMMTVGCDGDEPSPIGATIADHIGSQNVLAGILAALLARTRTGRGQQVDTSLLGGQIWAQASEYTSFLQTGRVPRRSNHGHSLVAGLYAIYPTADGWIAIVGVVGGIRQTFYELIGRPDLAESFASPLYTEDDKDALYKEMAPVFSTRSTEEWCAIFTAAGIRHAPVRDYAAVAADPGVWENGYLIKADDAGGNDDVVGTPVRFSDTPARTAGTVPELGQHTEEVLIEVGYSWEDIARLQGSGAI
ncbi:MAG TPA: CoA transferase [Acidimicrobiales bacterium]|jgi:CoA:oxalate CoA-transferase|nr:CoA transferase [Acidimicrobiales bacterium]